MLGVDFFALLLAANSAYGRPAADETYQLATSSTQCTVDGISLSLRSASQYSGTCDGIEDDGYVFLRSETCVLYDSSSTISNFKCRIRRMPCAEYTQFMCINADKSNTCQATMDSPLGIYTTSGTCPGDLLCCEGKVLYSVATFRELTASLPDDVLNQIAPGAENQFFSQQSDDIALLSNSGPLYQSFTNNPSTDGALGPASFDTVEGVDFDTFQLNPDPPAFRDDFPNGDSIFGAGQDDNEQLSASSLYPDLSLFYSFNT